MSECMSAFQIINRPLTEEELSRRREIDAVIAVEHGALVPEREQYDFVMLDGKDFVGCATGYMYRHNAGLNGWMYLYNLCLEKPYRRRGFGSRLLKSLENRAITLGVSRVWTHTVSYEAPGFYSQQGYHILHVCHGRHTPAHHEVFLRKHLPLSPHAVEDDDGPIRIAERPITDNELEKVNAGFNAHTREHGCPVQAFEYPGAVAIHGTAVVGAISGILRYDGDKVNAWFAVTDLMVEPEYRRSGVGTALLQNLESQAADLGVRFFTVQLAGYEAVDFFRSQGYEAVFEFEDWYPGGYSRVSLEKQT